MQSATGNNQNRKEIMNIQIKSYFDGRTLYKCEANTMLEALQAAIKAKANLRSADLRYANLRSADLSYADLRSANLRSADLRSADLSSADLSSANLSYADLRSANLRSADLSSANLLIYQTDIWTCYIRPEKIRIGCEYHSPEELKEYSDERISLMEARALNWWKRHKDAIFAIHTTFNEKSNQSI